MLPPFHYNESGSGAVLKVVPIDGDALVNGEAQTKLAGKVETRPTPHFLVIDDDNVFCRHAGRNHSVD